MKQICDILKDYELSEIDNSALGAVLYALQQGRLERKDLQAAVRKSVIMAGSCRPQGIGDVEQHRKVVMSAALEFLRNKKGEFNVNRDAGVGHQGKRQK